MAEHDEPLKSAANVSQASEGQVTDAGLTASSLQPVSGHERVAALDVLRGFAILGILLVNMAVFNSPFFYFLANVEQWPG